MIHRFYSWIDSPLRPFWLFATYVITAAVVLAATLTIASIGILHAFGIS